MTSYQGIVGFYELLDKGVLTWSVLKLCALVTTGHLVIRAVGLRGIPRLVMAVSVLTLLFFGVRWSLQVDLVNGMKVLARVDLGENVVNLERIGDLIRQGDYDGDMIFIYGNHLIRTRSASETLRFFQGIPPERLDQDFLQSMLTRVHLYARQYPEAAATARRTITLARSDYSLIWGYRALSDAYLGMGDRQKAMAVLEEELTVIPGDSAQKLIRDRIQAIRLASATAGVSP